MDKKHLTAAVLAIALLGCSTPKPETMQGSLVDPQSLSIPPPEFQRDLPLDPPEPLMGRVCKLGTSCMDLDSRPFEVCLVGAKHCVDKAREPLLVQAPEGVPEFKTVPLNRTEKP